jgi:hypothetical protein
MPNASAQKSDHKFRAIDVFRETGIYVAEFDADWLNAFQRIAAYTEHLEQLLTQGGFSFAFCP